MTYFDYLFLILVFSELKLNTDESELAHEPELAQGCRLNTTTVNHLRKTANGFDSNRAEAKMTPRHFTSFSSTRCALAAARAVVDFLCRVVAASAILYFLLREPADLGDYAPV